MKKVFLFVAVIAAISFASCSQNKQAKGTDSVDTVKVDSTSADTTQDSVAVKL